MTETWLPRLRRGCVQWLRTPQPRSGFPGLGDADARRAAAELAVLRARQDPDQ